MAKLSKLQAKHHAEACAILEKDHLNDDERLFVLEHWNEASERNPLDAGTFFTPTGLARDFAIDVVANGRVLDICAGIGSLSRFVLWRSQWNANDLDLTCIEINPRFVEIGRKIVPEARWICADAFDLPNLGLGHFDSVFGNPPYGRIARTKAAARPKRYQGTDFEYLMIDMMAEYADYGTFLIPQSSAPFRLSGQSSYHSENGNRKPAQFCTATNLVLEAGCGIDTSLYCDDWKATSIITEVVNVDYQDWRIERLQSRSTDLFSQGQHLAA